MKKTKDQIRNEMLDTIATYKEKIRLWQNVKRKTKKDGTDFQNLSKNFENAEIIVKYGDTCIQVVNYNIRIAGNYVDDYFQIEQVVQYFKAWEVPENRIIHEYCRSPYIRMSPDEIMKYIQYHISKYEKWITEYEEQLEKLDAMYDYVSDHLEELMDYIRKNAGNNSHLYYEMRGLIEKVGY